jgi:hypothetical protein
LLRTDTSFRLFGLSRNGWVSMLVTLSAVAFLVWREKRASSDHGPGASELETAA